MPDDAKHDDAKRRLEKTVEALQMRFGRRALRRGAETDDSIPRLSTGFPALDRLLGGGLPRGRIIELFGAPTAGTATLALTTVAQAQAQGQEAVYLDLERAFDPDYAARCGVLLSRVVLIHPQDPAQAFALLRDFATGDGVLVCDLPLSAPADPRLVRALSSTLGRVLIPLSQSSLVLLCLVSLPPGHSAYPPDFPLRHYATVRLQLQRERWLYRRRDIRGYRAQVLVAKNKLGKAGKTASIDFIFDNGAGAGP
jgi:recombination protein RecA